MKGALSQATARLMVFKLVMAAAKTWRRLQGQNQLPKVIKGVKFRDGIEVAPEPNPRLIHAVTEIRRSSLFKGKADGKPWKAARTMKVLPSTKH